MAWEPDRRSNFFFSPPAHLCAVTYMTEISLIVTLNNQFTLPYLTNTNYTVYKGYWNFQLSEDIFNFKKWNILSEDILKLFAGSSKSSTKPLSILLTKLLTHIKQGLQKYCETAYSRSGINQMWILKNSKELLEHLKFPTF